MTASVHKAYPPVIQWVVELKIFSEIIRYIYRVDPTHPKKRFYNINMIISGNQRLSKRLDTKI